MLPVDLYCMDNLEPKFTAMAETFRPYPFPILELAVSLFAIVLSVSVLINQNRQGRIDKISHRVEFEVNVRAENEVTKILNMLHEMHQHLGLQNQKKTRSLKK